MRTAAMLSLLAMTAAFAGCEGLGSPPSPESEATAAIKTRLGPDYDVHLMTTHKTPDGVVVCGYAGPKPMPPTDKAYAFPLADREFIFQAHKLTLDGDEDTASFEASIHKGCPGLIENPMHGVP